jgi:hypothetical protein
MARINLLVDPGPLREFIVADGRAITMIAEITGISERTVRGIVNRPRASVSLSTADQIITRLDGVLELVYPFQAEDV